MHFMEYSDGVKFVGIYVNVSGDDIKLGHDITIEANPIMTVYPARYDPTWIEVAVYL